jgi:2-succinyl-5-enolpyruvyl-6-hydroxy-3-cyclohexene-1-carboxylate synthase
VLDDDGGTIFDLMPPGAFPAQRRLFATPHGRDLTHLAALHGLASTRVADAQVGAAVLAAAEAGGRQLVHVPVRPLDGAASAAVRGVVASAIAAEEER